MDGKRQRGDTYVGGEKKGKRQRGTDIGQETEGNMHERRRRRRRGRRRKR